MYWGGLRQFKLKVGVPEDRERLERVAAYLRRPIRAGAISGGGKKTAKKISSEGLVRPAALHLY